MDLQLPFSTKKADKQIQEIKHNIWTIFPLYIVSWLGVWLLGYIVEYVNHASVWFPAAGLTFAGLLVIGSRIIPALVVCAVISTLWTGYFYQLDISTVELFVAGLVFSITHITPYYLATVLLKRLTSHQVSQLPSLIIISLIITMVSTLITAFAVTYGLVLTGLMDVKEMSSAWLPFWVGDLAGVIAVGPLFIGILCKTYSKPQFWLDELRDISALNNSSNFVFKLVMFGSVCTFIMLLAYFYPVQESNLAIFIMILPIMWLAFTESPARTSISVALFSTLVAFLVNLFGLMDFVLIYQFAICIIAASAFLCLSVPSLLAHNRELRQKITTDHLTGVASRSHLMNQAHFEIANSFSKNKQLSLIVFDLDNFKQINDSLGHSQGDKVLIEISRIATLSIRKTDLLSRLGGDEFVILLPNTALHEAADVAEKILKRIQSLELNIGVAFSCSFGVSQLRGGDEFKSLFERADKALYKAKNGGRSQVQVC